MCIFLYNSKKQKQTIHSKLLASMCVIFFKYIIHFERSLENMDYIDQLNTNCSDNLTEANQG